MRSTPARFGHAANHRDTVPAPVLAPHKRSLKFVPDGGPPACFTAWHQEPQSPQATCIPRPKHVGPDTSLGRQRPDRLPSARGPNPNQWNPEPVAGPHGRCFPRPLYDAWRSCGLRRLRPPAARGTRSGRPSRPKRTCPAGSAGYKLWPAPEHRRTATSQATARRPSASRAIWNDSI